MFQTIHFLRKTTTLINTTKMIISIGWIGLSSVLRPRQHSISYMGDSFYWSKDPTNSIKVLKENLQTKTAQRTKKTQSTHMCTHTK